MKKILSLILALAMLFSFAACGGVVMIIACVFSHGIGCWWYLIVFAVIMGIGVLAQWLRKK